MVRCGICLCKKPQDEVQVLQCKHSFCGPCLSIYSGSFCPAERCEGTRTTEILIDEMAEHGQQIPIGTHTINMLDYGEKLKCDGRRGVLQCTNVARMTLVNCRHNFCHDCLVKKFQRAKTVEMAPTCPHPFCANKIEKAEVHQLAMCYPLSNALCAHIEKLITHKPQVIIAGKEEMLVDCSLYGKETTSQKRIVIPKACLVTDMISAILQLHKLSKMRSPANIAFYIRHDEKEKGSTKYEQILPKLVAKEPVSKMAWPDPMTLIIDVENSLAKRK